MAFNSPVVGDTILHTDITQFINNWSGVAGFGVAFENIQVNETSKYAGDFQNLDTTNSYGLRVRDSSSNALFAAALAGCTLSKTTTLSRGTITTDLKVLDASATWNAAGVTFTAMKLNVTDTASAAASLLLDLQVGGTSKFNATKGGILFIGDTANTGMTVGLTINQGASNDEAFTLKSSDIAHGITDYTETDTYLKIGKLVAADGGAQLRAFNEVTTGLQLDAFGVTDDTTKSTAGRSYLELQANKKSGTGGALAGTDANLVGIRNYGTTRFIFDAEGTLHSIGASYSDQIGNGLWFINDTANANMTVGITINQGTNDNEALALKSSDVAHGITDVTETDTFGFLRKVADADGGLVIRGLNEITEAILIHGIGVTDNTAKTTAARAYTELWASKKSGTSTTNPGADANIVAFILADGTTRFIFDAEGTLHSIGASYSDQIGNGKWFINDTSNANMTVGLTINQGANDDHALALKSSDVAHGITTTAETDTYFTVGKAVSTDGGAALIGFSDATIALSMQALGNTDVTTKLSTSRAYAEILVGKRSGEGVTVPGADANLVSIRLAAGDTQFIFDVEGSAHANVEWVAFDDYDDMALLNTLDAEFRRRRDPIKNEFGAFLQEHRDILQQEKIVNFYDPDGPRAMVNFTRLSMLMAGTIRQLGQRLQLAEQKLSLLPGGDA